MTAAHWRVLLGAAMLAPGAVHAQTQAQTQTQTHEWRFHAPHVLGASLDMTVVAPDPAAALAAARAARTEIARLDAVFSRWRPDSALSRLSAGPRPAELAAVIEAAERWRELTSGAFDARRGTGFDLDGIAKGYIVDQALAAARRTASIEGGLVDIGGDLKAWGRSPSPEGWRVGVADPVRLQDNAEPAQVLRIVDKAVAFSGPGLRGAHIRMPGGGLARTSAAVVAPRAADADALATALCAMPPHEAIALADRLGGFEAMVIGEDGRRRATQGWDAVAEPRLIKAQAASHWPPGFSVTLDYEIPAQTSPRALAPYVAVWVTDSKGAAVRTLTLLGSDDRFIDQNFIWWRRIGRVTRDIDAVAKPTRKPGRYGVTWDGRDDKGAASPQGRYTVHVEAVREHGGHSYQTFDLVLGTQPVTAAAPASEELGPSALRYGPGR